MIGTHGHFVPVPKVGKCVELRFRGSTGNLLKQHVIVGLGVELRVKVYKVNRLGGDVLPQDVKVIPKIKLVAEIAHKPII